MFLNHPMVEISYYHLPGICLCLKFQNHKFKNFKDFKYKLLDPVAGLES